jgi:hypothetical protein
MTKVKAYTRSDGVSVSAYERGKPEPEDGTGVEVPNIAPKSGSNTTKIVMVPKAGEPRKLTNGGVTIMGGAEHGRQKGAEVRRVQRGR